jgi:hypothetical protein
MSMHSNEEIVLSCDKILQSSQGIALSYDHAWYHAIIWVLSDYTPRLRYDDYTRLTYVASFE